MEGGTLRTGFWGGLIGQGGDEFGWGDQAVAGRDELGDFGPVDFGGIQAQGDPTSGGYVGGEEEASRMSGGESGVVAGKDFRGYGDDAVAVMVVEEPGEVLFADLKSGVLAAIEA